MSQDGSSSLNHRLPAASAFHLAFASDRPFVPLRTSASPPASSFLSVLLLLRPSRRRLHLRGRFLSRRQLGNLPHAYTAATLLLPFRLVVTDIPNFASITIKSIGIIFYREINYRISKSVSIRRRITSSVYLKNSHFMRLILKYKTLLHR